MSAKRPQPPPPHVEEFPSVVRPTSPPQPPKKTDDPYSASYVPASIHRALLEKYGAALQRERSLREAAAEAWSILMWDSGRKQANEAREILQAALAATGEGGDDG